MCCACNGSCNHVGQHFYCATHGGAWQNPPTFTYTNFPPSRRLSDEDVERVAQRVVELIDAFLPPVKKRKKK